MREEALITQLRRDLIAVSDRIRAVKGINMSYVTRDVIIELLMDEPAPRFYLEPRTIGNIVTLYERGIKPKYAVRNRELYDKRDRDLYETYKRVKAEHPKCKWFEIMQITGEQPAKSFYLSKRCTRDIIYGYRK